MTSLVFSVVGVGPFVSNAAQNPQSLDGQGGRKEDGTKRGCRERNDELKVTERRTCLVEALSPAGWELRCSSSDVARCFFSRQPQWFVLDRGS